MAAYLTVELDTTAPVVTLGTPTFDHLTRILTMPYTLDEVGIEGVDFISDSGQVLPMGVTPSDLVVQVPSEASRAGQVQARARDEVLNAGVYSRVVSATLEILDSVAAAIARLASMVTARARIGSGSTGREQMLAVASARPRFASEVAARRAE